MKRREFLGLVGGAAVAGPFSKRAWSQETPSRRPQLPAIGLLSSVSLSSISDRIEAFHRGLKEASFAEGQNVEIRRLSAEGQFDRLPALAADFVAQKVAVIVTVGGT